MVVQAQRRTIGPKSEGPAPTAYNVAPPPPVGPSWSFPSTVRDLEGAEDDDPAPGDYCADVRPPLPSFACMILPAVLRQPFCRFHTRPQYPE